MILMMTILVIEITNKILNLSFKSKKDIKILLEYRDENLSYKPKFIHEE